MVPTATDVFLEEHVMLVEGLIAQLLEFTFGERGCLEVAHSINGRDRCPAGAQ